jgi:hypothetical protein
VVVGLLHWPCSMLLASIKHRNSTQMSAIHETCLAVVASMPGPIQHSRPSRGASARAPERVVVIVSIYTIFLELFELLLTSAQR